VRTWAAIFAGESLLPPAAAIAAVIVFDLMGPARKLALDAGHAAFRGALGEL
jgi:hypothetical protein